MAAYQPVVPRVKQALLASSTRFPVQAETKNFPFSCALTLAPLADFWASIPAKNTAAGYAVQETVQEILRIAPELLAPLTDLSVIARHRELLDILMTVVIPQAAWKQVATAALLPFQWQSFYATPMFEQWLLNPEHVLVGEANMDPPTLDWYKIVRAYTVILQQVYNIRSDVEYPLIVTRHDPQTKLPRHFQLYFDRRFVRVKTQGTPPPLSAQAEQRLLANITDPQVLMELLPPPHFALEGFMMCNAVEVTDQEVLSALKRGLIEQPSMVSITCFSNLLEQLRAFFRRPHLHVALMAFRGRQALRLTCEQQIQYECIFADSTHYDLDTLQATIYGRLFERDEFVIVDDLAIQSGQTPLEEASRAKGIRSLLLTPLFFQDTLIGALELASPYAGDLQMAEAFKLREALPLFSMLIKRGLDELEGKIQSVIRQKCTAIHPTVEWRFERAAVPYIMRRREGVLTEVEPIVFHDVYPLYAVSDIRGSSTARNHAIQADLIEHLHLAHAVIKAAYQARPMPILDELDYRLSKHLQHISAGLHSGDEVALLDFFAREVEPLFLSLEHFAPAVQECIRSYHALIQPPHGTVYQRRKDFEESVALINATIDTYLEEEDLKAQRIFPHYFEKHKTDGVEFGIYVGASLVEDGQFNAMYLRNMRLWQCLILCQIVRQMAQLRHHLKVPLETAHLILVQNVPLTIRFLFDEKRFNVEGAYDIRYEIMKKRIDKAVIRGTEERLTQPGKIAIVYSHPREAMEYREYIDYLQARDYLEPDIEDVELEDLQGIQGLRALRVSVILSDQTPAIDLHEVQAGVCALTAEAPPPVT